MAESTATRRAPARRRGAGLGLAVCGLLAVVSACGGGSASGPASPDVAGGSGKCPDLSKPDEVSAFDFAGEYMLSRDAADKVRAAALASNEVAKLADKLDAELGIACAQVAQSLGDRGDWRTAGDACTAAIKAVREARARSSGKAKATLVASRPLCLVDATLPTTCASICDSSVPADRAKAECTDKAGRCDGACDGVCAPKSAAKCDGDCSGTCDGPMRGTCGGRCKGTCDGKPSAGPCTGFCAGSCSGGVTLGDCRGQCAGTCKSKTPAACEGVCAGSCTVEWSEPKCAGGFKVPDVSTDCRARCDLAVMNGTECGEPRVSYLVVPAGKDHASVDAMKGAVDKAFPGLMKVLYEVGEKGSGRVLVAQAVIDGARGGFRDMAASGGRSTQANSQARLESCFAERFKKASSTASAVKAMLDQAEAVRDEATK